MKSDVLNIHLTNAIHGIGDSINGLIVNVSDMQGSQLHDVKFSINSTFPCKKLKFLYSSFRYMKQVIVG